MPVQDKTDPNAVRSFDEALGSDWSVASRLAAINRSFAIVEMTPDGRVIHANAIFLKLMGYTMPDIKNQHHKMFCFPEFADRAGYHEFWGRLLKGEHVDDKQLRRRSTGEPVWLQAVYVPVLSAQGKVERVLKVAVDITTAQQAKFDAENKMSALSRSIATIEFGVDGKIMATNENFCETFGYTPEEIVAEHHSILCDDDYVLTDEYALFWQRLRKGEFHTGVYPRRHRDGHRIWLSASYNPIQDLTGNVVKVVKFAQNVTDYYERAASSVQQIASLMAAQAVIECDTAGMVLDANAIFLSRTGFTRDVVVGRPLIAIFSDSSDILGVEREVWQEVLAGETVTYPLVSFQHSGETIWWNATINAIRDADGRPNKVVIAATDITVERRLANEAMAQNAAIDAAFARAEYSSDGTIIAVNERFAKTLGYAREALIGQHHSMLSEGEEAYNKVLTEVWEPLLRGESVSTRIRRRRSDGSTIWVQVGYSPIFDLKGRLLKVFVCGFDITQTMMIDSAVADGVAEIEAVLTKLRSLRG